MLFSLAQLQALNAIKVVGTNTVITLADKTSITLVGVKDSILVLTDDATLVASKSESQKIKDLVRKLAADPRWADRV